MKKIAVLNDLSEENINNLPDISYNGHVVRVAARALKMRVLLYEKKYEEVIEQYEKIKSSKASLNLSPNYSELFNPNTQENNPEILFSVKHTYPNGVSSDLDMSLYTWGEIQVRREFTDSFEFLDGSKFSTSNPLYNPDHPFDNRDKRLKATAIDSTYGIFNRRPNGAAGLEKDHFICAKYVDTLKAPVNIVLISDQDYIILRYADVLLMYAEAKNELQGPSSDIYEVLGLIRERAGLPNLPPNLTKDQMRDKIKHERKVEFGMEGPLRYFDLKRWKDMPAVVTKIKDPGSTDFRKWDDKWYIWPFPQEAIDKNPSLIQNPF